jgi:hypothetical protein
MDCKSEDVEQQISIISKSAAAVLHKYKEIGSRHGSDVAAAVLRAAADLTGPSSVVIFYLGGRQYRIGDYQPKYVTDSEDALLQAFTEQNVMDEILLKRKSGLSHPAKIFRDLRRKYGGYFRDALTPAGKKGGGGYHAIVTNISL